MRTVNDVFDDVSDARARGNYFRTDGRSEEVARLERNADKGHVL